MMLLAIKGLHVQPDVGLNATASEANYEQDVIKMKDVLGGLRISSEEIFKN